jgi:hypothetical protein
MDDDHSSSSAIAGGIKRPTRRLRTGRPDNVSLFGLAPCGVLPATRVTTGAVRSYRTFSPLPASALAGFGAAGLATCRWLCIFCATFLQVALTGRYPAHCPAEFGLSSHLRALRRFGGRSSDSLRRDRFYIGREGQDGRDGQDDTREGTVPASPAYPARPPCYPSVS